MNWPSLSIIIPSFNQGAYIERTILSILKQNYEGELEIIVSDGGSKDKTVEILKKYPQIIWWSKPDRGYVDAVTKAIAVAKGEILAIQSSDDFYLRDAFKISIKELIDNPDVAIITGCDVQLMPDMNSYYTSELISSEVTPYSILTKRMIGQHCTFFRRIILDKIGGLREEVDVCADIDLWYRALHFFKGKFIPFYTAVYQNHPNQRTKILDTWYSGLVKMVESCESDPFYGSQLRFSERERKNIYARFEVGLGKQPEQEQLLVKMTQILESEDYTQETKEFVHSTLAHRGYLSRHLEKEKIADKLIQILTDGNLVNRAKIKLYQAMGIPQNYVFKGPQIDINWWKK